MLLFKTNRGFGAVAGIYNAIIRQGEQLFANVVDQQVIVTAREVGTPDASPEQHIAAYQ